MEQIHCSNYYGGNNIKIYVNFSPKRTLKIENPTSMYKPQIVSSDDIESIIESWLLFGRLPIANKLFLVIAEQQNKTKKLK